MARIIVTAIISIFVIAHARATPQKVEQRGNVTYSAEDWSRSDTQHKVDVQPQPVGGMKAFVSRLDYPASLRQQGITGIVKVRVSLDAAGHVLSAQIIQSANSTLDAIVLRAVRQTKWQPALKAGKPVPYAFKFPVTFRRHA